MLEKRLAEWDVPQSLSVVNTFEIPIGKGKWVGGSMNKWLNGVIGGWNLNWQWMRQSGFPVAFPNAAPISPGTARYTDGQRNANAQAAGRPEWDVQFDKFFNTTLFPKTAQAPYTLRNFPTRFPDVRTKPWTSHEISLYKEFGLYERMRMQIRADCAERVQPPILQPNAIRGRDQLQVRAGAAGHEERREDGRSGHED